MNDTKETVDKQQDEKSEDKGYIILGLLFSWWT